MMNREFSFEKLQVWQKARELAKLIYQFTDGFPAQEKFGLVLQTRRAMLSVCANIAEGTTRLSSKEQAHFSTIAFSSLMETLNHLIISFDLGFLEEEKYYHLRNNIQPLSAQLARLKATQISRINPKS
jgi:four helix bundle protein